MSDPDVSPFDKLFGEFPLPVEDASQTPQDHGGIVLDREEASIVLERIVNADARFDAGKQKILLAVLKRLQEFVP